MSGQSTPHGPDPASGSPGASDREALSPDSISGDGSGGHDLWRDRGAGAMLGPPAVDTTGDGDVAPRSAGPLLSVPELLFGRRVKPSALLILLVCALLVGAAGGFVGWAVGSAGSS